MLVPHGRKNAKLGEARCPADEGEDARIFVRLQAMRGGKVWGDFWFGSGGQGTSGSRGDALGLDD